MRQAVRWRWTEALPVVRAVVMLNWKRTVSFRLVESFVFVGGVGMEIEVPLMTLEKPGTNTEKAG